MQACDLFHYILTLSQVLESRYASWEHVVWPSVLPSQVFLYPGEISEASHLVPWYMVLKSQFFLSRCLTIGHWFCGCNAFGSLPPLNVGSSPESKDGGLSTRTIWDIHFHTSGWIRTWSMVENVSSTFHLVCTVASESSLGQLQIESGSGVLGLPSTVYPFHRNCQAVICHFFLCLAGKPTFAYFLTCQGALDVWKFPTAVFPF